MSVNDIVIFIISICNECEKCVMEAWKKLNQDNVLSESRYHIWRTIATLSLSINGFILGLFIGFNVFQ